jgi:hypothetical protein
MKRLLQSGLAGLLALSAAAVAPAFVAIRVPVNLPVARRASMADMIVLGKVTAIEENTVKTTRSEMHVAVVKVKETFLGAKGLTHVKVAFRTAAVPQPPRPGEPRPHIRRPVGFGPPTLTVGQEAIFFLKPEAKQVYFVVDNVQQIIDAKAADFKKAVDDLKGYTKTLADPMTALKAKDAKARFEAASALLNRYRTARAPVTQQEAVPAAESKLILEALADADWSVKQTQPGQQTPLNLFYMLQLTPADGWTQPRNFQELPAAARKWLKDNAGKYTLKRMVPVLNPGPK